MSTTHPLPGGIPVAVRAAEAAAARLDEALVDYRRSHDPASPAAEAVTAALVETVVWIDLLDEYGWDEDKPDHKPIEDYVRKRMDLPGGPETGGLSYVRNFSLHHIHLVAGSEEGPRLIRPGERPDPLVGPEALLMRGRRGLFKSDLLWVPFADLPRLPMMLKKKKMKKKPHYKDEMYRQAVAGERLADPINKALVFLKQVWL
jgi:hypothetical protein